MQEFFFDEQLQCSYSVYSSMVVGAVKSTLSLLTRLAAALFAIAWPR